MCNASLHLSKVEEDFLESAEVINTSQDSGTRILIKEARSFVSH